MTKRMAGESEVPKYGDVWVWEDGQPMMAVAPTGELLPGTSSRVQRFLFVHLTGKVGMVKMWAGANEKSVWFVLDE